MDVKTTLYIVENACGCRLCKGTQRCTTPLESELHKNFMGDRIQLQTQGARNPAHFYAPLSFEFISLSATRKPFREPPKNYSLFGVFADSVHSCGNVKRNCATEIWVPSELKSKIKVVLTRQFDSSLADTYKLKEDWHYFITPTLN